MITKLDKIALAILALIAVLVITLAYLVCYEAEAIDCTKHTKINKDKEVIPAYEICNGR